MKPVESPTGHEKESFSMWELCKDMFQETRQAKYLVESQTGQGAKNELHPLSSLPLSSAIIHRSCLNPVLSCIYSY